METEQLKHFLEDASFLEENKFQIDCKLHALEEEKEKGRTKEFELYRSVEQISGRLLAARRRSGKPISANVDFYSGFVYSMLGIPIELFTPIFAIARIAGWSAHRIEELVNAGKIIRPAYKYVGTHREYLPMEDR